MTPVTHAHTLTRQNKGALVAPPLNIKPLMHKQQNPIPSSTFASNQALARWPFPASDQPIRSQGSARAAASSRPCPRFGRFSDVSCFSCFSFASFLLSNFIFTPEEVVCIFFYCRAEFARLASREVPGLQLCPLGEDATWRSRKDKRGCIPGTFRHF